MCQILFPIHKNKIALSFRDIININVNKKSTPTIRHNLSKCFTEVDQLKVMNQFYLSRIQKNRFIHFAVVQIQSIKVTFSFQFSSYLLGSFSMKMEHHSSCSNTHKNSIHVGLIWCNNRRTPQPDYLFTKQTNKLLVELLLVDTYWSTSSQSLPVYVVAAGTTTIHSNDFGLTVRAAFDK